jgi:hypothetical protein
MIKIGTPNFLKMLNKWNKIEKQDQKMYCPYSLVRLNKYFNFKQCDECTKIFGLYSLRKRKINKSSGGPCPCTYIDFGYNKIILKLNEYGYKLINNNWVYKEDKL